MKYSSGKLKKSIKEFYKTINMKKIFFLIITLSIYLNLYSQTTQLGKAEYLEIRNVKAVKFISEQWQSNIKSLYFTNKESVYLYDKDEDYTFRVTNGVSVGDGFAFDIIDKRSKFYTNFSEKKVYSQETDYGENLFTLENLAKINWEITKETKQISNYNCIKATCRFRGRNYTAWFTPQIPISSGPWKLQGLPGLILQAGSEDNQVQFILKKIQFPYSKIDKIFNEDLIKGKEFISPLELESIYSTKISMERDRVKASVPEGVTITFGEIKIQRVELEFEEGIEKGIKYGKIEN